MASNNIIFKNAIFLIIRTLIISLVGFISIRELLNVLGIEGYGVFNLIFGVATLFAFLNGAMISSTQRYLSYYLGRDEEKFQYVWKSSLILHVTIGILVASFLYFLGDFILNNLLNLDIKFKNIATYIYIYSIVAIFISIIQAPFNALVLAYEKMSFFAFLSLFDAVLKLGVIFLLYLFNDKFLERYTFLFVLSSLIVFFVYVTYCLKKFNVKLNIRDAEYSILKEMLYYCMWNIFGNFSFIFKIQGLNVIINIFFGVIINSTYTITNTVVSVVSSLVNSVVTAFNPQIYKSYAISDFERTKSLINLSSKFSFFLAYIVVIPVVFNIDILLNYWLHHIPPFLNQFIRLSLIILLVDCLSGSLMTGIQATGRVKVYQIIVSFFIILNLPLSYLILKQGGEPYTIYIVSLIISLICLIIRLCFLKKSANFSIKLYLKNVILKVLMVTFISYILILFLINMIGVADSFIKVIFSCFVIDITILLSILLFGLSSKEKKAILSKTFGYLK